MLFLDTEFTDLKLSPRLLSIAFVSSSHDGEAPPLEFYAEVTDADRLRAACPFVQEAVLPQFGQISGAACSYEVLRARVAAFLRDIAKESNARAQTVIAFGSDLDWALLDRCLLDPANPDPGRIKPTWHPRNVYNMAGFAVGAAAAQKYFSAQLSANAPIGRHHALCDARALREFYIAASAAKKHALRGGSQTAPT